MRIWWSQILITSYSFSSWFPLISPWLERWEGIGTILTTPPTPSPTSKHSTLPRNPTLLPRPLVLTPPSLTLSLPTLSITPVISPSSDFPQIFYLNLLIRCGKYLLRTEKWGLSSMMKSPNSFLGVVSWLSCHCQRLVHLIVSWASKQWGFQPHTGFWILFLSRFSVHSRDQTHTFFRH